MEEHVTARGHENVAAEHPSTFEVTTDDYLTPAGDCILGIEADRAPADFDRAFVEACRDEDARIEAEFVVELDGTVREYTATGWGHPELSFTNARSLVGRTSDYVDDRTVLVGADAASADFDRGIVQLLADGAGLELTLRVSP